MHMLVVVYSSSSIVPAAAQHLISFCLKFAFGVQNLDQAGDEEPGRNHYNKAQRRIGQIGVSYRVKWSLSTLAAI